LGGSFFTYSVSAASQRHILNGFRVNEHELDVRLTGELVLDERLASYVPGAALHPHGHRFQ
jgi:hypothetical protein